MHESQGPWRLSLHATATTAARPRTARYLKQLANGFTSVPLDARSTYPSPPFGQVIPLNHASHGNGFANTGAMDRDAPTPLPPASKIKFTQPGTYRYMCLIHPFTHGTIVVSAAAARATRPRPTSSAPRSGTSPGFTG